MGHYPDLRFTRVRFRLSAESPIYLPPYGGSVFRGGFGAALRRACCTMRRTDCRGCPLALSCVYASVFETAAGHVAKSRYQLANYPRPFVIEPPFPCPQEIRAGESFSCLLVLLGNAPDLLPYFVYAFSELGKMGIGAARNGRARGRYRVDSVACVIEKNEKMIFDGRTGTFVDTVRPKSFDAFFGNGTECTSVALDFETPTRIKYRNRLTVDLSFELLMKNVLRRLSLLVEVCAGQPWDIDFAGLLEKARHMHTRASSIRWYDWKRYSGRQKNSMKLGGFVGRIRFEGDMAPFLPYLRLGEYFHVGKACTFGLGKYGIIRSANQTGDA